MHDVRAALRIKLFFLLINFDSLMIKKITTKKKYYYVKNLKIDVNDVDFSRDKRQKKKKIRKIRSQRSFFTRLIIINSRAR